MAKHLVSIHGLTLYEFHALMDLAREVKHRPGRYRDRLAGKALALVFAFPQHLSRAAFELGMRQMGGTTVYLPLYDAAPSAGRTTLELGQNLERWVDGIVLLSPEHKQVVELAGESRIAVINAGSDLVSPCQALADLLFIKENLREPASTRLAYVGNGNSVCHSLMLAAAKAGVCMTVATPAGFDPDADIVRQAEADGRDTGFILQLTHDPSEAVARADVVYASLWPLSCRGSSHGDETRVLQLFQPYRVTRELMALAAPDALFMHSQPLQPGREVAEDVLGSDGSTVFEQAENKLYIQKAIMVSYLEENSRDDE
jgi:ornithine carbamoyltransferase